MKLLTSVFAFVLFTLLLAAPPAYLTYTGYTNYLIPHFWLLFAFLSGFSFITIMTILIGGQINTDMYAQIFLAATVFKILAILVFVLVFLLKNKVERVDFAVSFIYIYFLNTAFEVYVLLRNLRNQKLR